MPEDVTVPIVLNLEPHYIALPIKSCSSYPKLTAQDVLTAAREFCVEYYNITDWVPNDVPMRLRYIKEKSKAFDPNDGDPDTIAARLGLPSKQIFNDDNVCQYRATMWYRTTGYHVSSVDVQPSQLLSAFGKGWNQLVRWYVVVCVSTIPHHWPHYIPRDREQVLQRNAYIKAMRHKIAHRMENGVAPPSTVSKFPAKFDEVQSSETPICIGIRPYDSYGPHPALFCRPFADAHNKQMKPSDVKVDMGLPGTFNMSVWLAEFAKACSATTKGEKEYVSDIYKLLLLLIDDPGLRRGAVYQDGDGTVCELDMEARCKTAHGWEAIYLVIECKEWSGSGGDPVAQAVLAYQRAIMMPEFKHILRMTCCPCLIIGISNSLIRVHTVYFSDRVYGTVLFAHPLDGSQTSQIRLDLLAPFFQIIRDTAAQLRKWYAEVHTGTDVPHAPHLFPQPLSIISPAESTAADSAAPESAASLGHLNLVLLERVGPPTMPHRCLYKGIINRLDGSAASRVYVKFVVKRYGKLQHELLADHGYAPALHYCAEVMRGLTMVIMDELRGYSLTKTSLMKKYTTIIQRDISAALELLHGQNFVHGDIRPPNVVISGNHASLIDFDWAGIHGEERYPPVLNPDLHWHPSAKPDQPILKEHDKFMLNQLTVTGSDTGSKDKKRLRESSGESGRASKKSKVSSEGLHSMPPPTSIPSRPSQSS